MRKRLKKTMAILLSAGILLAAAPFAAATGTDVPEETPAAEMTPEPEITPAPEQTPEPEATAGPEETPEPEETPAPEETPEPEESPAPEESPEPEETPGPETPAEGDILETRVTVLADLCRYTGTLAAGLTFPQAAHLLLSDFADSVVQAETELRAEWEPDEMTFTYEDGSLTGSANALPFIAAAFAAQTGRTPDELADAELTAGQLSVLRAAFLGMSSLTGTLTETDVADGTVNGETGEPNFTTKRSITLVAALSRDASPLGLNAEENARYRALRADAEAWDKLVSLCRGDAWVESGAGESVKTLREDVVRIALAQQGKIGYRWGGKYNALGRDPLWGFPQQDDDGSLFAGGLDCSGFVTWVLLNAAGTAGALSSIGEGTSAQRLACEAITREELRPGDLVFGGEGTAETDHVGIVTGFSSDGRVLMCHCMQGGVTVSYADDFGMDSYYRPAAYYAAYETPHAVPEISVTGYVEGTDGTVWLVKIAEEPGTRCRWTLDGVEMLYSESYGAWCALTADAGALETRVSRVRQNGREDVGGDGDVNGSGTADINDAQRIYSISCGQQRFEAKNAEAWLKADRNGDGKITAEDASELLRLI